MGPRPLAVLLALAASALMLALPVSGALGASLVPSVATSGASNATYSSVVVYGNVNRTGWPPTTCSSTARRPATARRRRCRPAGNGTISIKVSQTITGLQAGTLYHYRIVAVNPAGTADGDDRTFTTRKIPLSVQLAGVPNPVVFGKPFFVEGTLSGTGAANHEVDAAVQPVSVSRGLRERREPRAHERHRRLLVPLPGPARKRPAARRHGRQARGVSPVVIESVAVHVTVHVRRTHRRGYVRLYGTVAPAEPGALVGFQLLEPGTPRSTRAARP